MKYSKFLYDVNNTHKNSIKIGTVGTRNYGQDWNYILNNEDGSHLSNNIYG